jgi:hypothetical protein
MRREWVVEAAGAYAEIARRASASVASSPIFSPDGKHVALGAFGVTNGQDLLVVIDGHTGAEYGSLAQDPFFGSDAVLEYLAARKGSLYRVKYIRTP